MSKIIILLQKRLLRIAAGICCVLMLFFVSAVAVLADGTDTLTDPIREDFSNEALADYPDFIFDSANISGGALKIENGGSITTKGTAQYFLVYFEMDGTKVSVSFSGGLILTVSLTEGSAKLSDGVTETTKAFSKSPVIAPLRYTLFRLMLVNGRLSIGLKSYNEALDSVYSVAAEFPISSGYGAVGIKAADEKLTLDGLRIYPLTSGYTANRHDYDEFIDASPVRTVKPVIKDGKKRLYLIIGLSAGGVAILAAASVTTIIILKRRAKAHEKKS